VQSSADTRRASRAVYELDGVSLDGHRHFFRKPWFMTTIMFVGMSFCLPLAYLEERSKNKREAAAAADGTEPLLTNGQEVCRLRRAAQQTLVAVFHASASELLWAQQPHTARRSALSCAPLAPCTQLPTTPLPGTPCRRGPAARRPSRSGPSGATR
jgi:hypothetical protein